MQLDVSQDMINIKHLAKRATKDHVPLKMVDCLGFQRAT